MNEKPKRRFYILAGLLVVAGLHINSEFAWSAPAKSTGRSSPATRKQTAEEIDDHRRLKAGLETYRDDEGGIRYVSAVKLSFAKPQRQTFTLSVKQGANNFSVNLPPSRTVWTYNDSKDGKEYLAVRDLRIIPGDTRRSTLPRKEYTFTKYLAQRFGQDKDEFRLRDPQLSPNGRFVLFQFYSQDPPYKQEYRIYVLDLESNELTRASHKILNYRRVVWSPDSNHIAFTEHGDNYGRSAEIVVNEERYLGPLKLYVCNWRTGELQLVRKSDSLQGPLAWLDAARLLYDSFTDADATRVEWQSYRRYVNDSEWAEYAPKADKWLRGRPERKIYEYSLGNKSSRVVFNNGYAPVPSPDGKRIAFFGLEELPATVAPQAPYKTAPYDERRYLMVSNADGSRRRYLDNAQYYNADIFWLSDNRHFVALSQRQDPPQKNGILIEWDSETGRSRKIPVPFAPVRLDFSRPEIQILAQSRDEKTLWVKTMSSPDSFGESKPERGRASLIMVNIETGKTETVLRQDNISGFDWIEFPSK